MLSSLELDPSSSNASNLIHQFKVQLNFLNESMKQQFDDPGPTAIMAVAVSKAVFNATVSPVSVMNSTPASDPTTETLAYPDYSQIGIVRGLFVCLFLVEFVVGVLGNLLVCATVYRNKAMHSPVNYYIVNLGVCDFLVMSFVLPTKLFELTAEASMNMMNDLWCTLIRFFESVIVFVSVFTLVAICIERYYAVVYPMHSRIHLTDYRIRRVLLLVWIVPILVASPNLYPAVAGKHLLFSEFGEFSRLTCFDTFSDQFRMYYFLFLFFFMYFLPLLFIGTTCFSITRALMQKIPVQPRRDQRAITLEHGRRKVAKMVLVIVCAFVICWSPYFLVTAVTQLQSENFLHHGHFFFTMLSINLLCFTNSCVNPFVYFAMSARFRKGFIGILKSVSFCSRRSRYSPDTSLTSMRRTMSHRGMIQNGAIHRFPGVTTTATTKRCASCHQVCQPGNSHQNRRSESSSSSTTPPKSSGNPLKGRPASYYRHKRQNSSRARSHTIVFEFRNFSKPPAEAELEALKEFVSPGDLKPCRSYQESNFL